MGSTDESFSNTEPRGLTASQSRPADIFTTAAVPGRGAVLDACRLLCAAARGDAPQASFDRKLSQLQRRNLGIAQPGHLLSPSRLDSGRATTPCCHSDTAARSRHRIQPQRPADVGEIAPAQMDHDTGSSAKSFGTGKFVLCWLHHGIYRSEKQVRNDHTFITLIGKVWCQVHLKVWTSLAQGNLWHGSHIRKDWVKTRFQKGEQSADILRGNESIFRDANPANVAKSLLEGNRDHLLTQARSELMKQEHKVESLSNCINELQQPAYAQRVDLEIAHHGFHLGQNPYRYGSFVSELIKKVIFVIRCGTFFLN